MTGPTRPNVVLFMLDTQQAQNMSCYGYPKPTTPNIDRLAAEGAVFLDNVSPAIWTLPSTASMMTGLHVHSHGACAHNDVFIEKPVTLAETLAELGYDTVAFYANNYCAASCKGFREIHRNYGSGNQPGPGKFYRSRERTQEAIDWIERNPLRHRKRPFFLFIQVMDPHMPLHPVSPFRERFLLPGSTEEEVAAIKQGAPDVHAMALQLTERQYQIMESLYDGETAGADSHVGVLADFLRERSLLDDTMFIVTSDHGDMRGEHSNEGFHDHYGHHLCVYEELIKVPLVIRYPDQIPAGARVAHPTQTLDVFPTLAEILGFEARPCQGFSVLSALTDHPKRDFTLTEYMSSNHIALRMLDRYDPAIDPRIYLRWLKAWRQGGFKYIWTSDRRDELFDLRVDAQERDNLIEKLPEKAQEMRMEMTRFLARLPLAYYGDKAVTARVKPETVDLLRGLEFFHEMM
ncbi:MAG: sulfatase [Candidatus Sumerlaeota bacterium]|nr:sulfatase [Candidatus Sumerlaeota bacterium]